MIKIESAYMQVYKLIWKCDECGLSFSPESRDVDPIRCPFEHQPSISDITGE